MKINELIYQTPEMSEEKLLKLIDERTSWISFDLRKRLHELHKELSLNEAILKEYDLIQDKKSNLSKSQREIILGFVGICLIKMTRDNSKNDEIEEVNDGTS